MKRRTDIKSLQEKTFDLLIIGGGITGAGIFHEATARGYRCLLIEKGDFASGTSSRSAKLIHGGIRYLKYGKLGLIKESLEERNYLLKTYPHLVKPLPFLFPVYDSPVKYRVGMAMYHYLDNHNALPDYQYIEKEEVIKYFSPINQENLRAGFIYYDAVTNDARLCSEVIHSTMQRSGSVAFNYCELESTVADGENFVVHCHDHLAQQPVAFKTRFLANAGGIWTDDIQGRLTNAASGFSAPSKGIHLVFSKKRFPVETALVIPSYADDGRMNYALPWENDTVIAGTTDTEYSGNLNIPLAANEDVQYVLESIQKFAPSLRITADDILFVYAGLRPLFREEKSSAARSRDYQIWWSSEKILNIYGGKLTSFHSMANAFMDEFQTKAALISSEKMQPFQEKKWTDRLPISFVLRLKAEYAEQCDYIFSIALEQEPHLETLNKSVEITIAELIYFIRFQQCYHLDDLLARRLSLIYCINGWEDREAIIRKAAGVMKTECGWTDEELGREIELCSRQLNLPLPGNQQTKA